MQSIINALRSGTGKDRLAVVSDIVSILGVSAVTILGGAFALNAKLDVENILGAVILGLLSFAGALVVVALFLSSANWLERRFQSGSSVGKLLLSALWLLFAALFVYSTYFGFVVLSSMRFVKP
ncbi:hypothetical protein [Massilia sp. TS11]|uniref:hypothetical protein n=1 Tax=Massilia sp. TS11 TaxID=2908003 RepID=UPI001EDBF4F1|nr:hypothetical protein [Massilia sp. TS11]MCG2583065.1 hypothetical protein [Massilia sp. TS11]